MSRQQLKTYISSLNDKTTLDSSDQMMLLDNSGELRRANPNIITSSISTELSTESSERISGDTSLENAISEFEDSGSGGFLGSVTKDTASISEPKDNQWVLPIPTSTNEISYTFDNFLDNLDNGIFVNLALEHVYLRYNESGEYWEKVSFFKSIPSDKVLVGDVNNRAFEYDIIQEWVTDENLLDDVGQKFSLPTQNYNVVGFENITISPNIIIKDINLKESGITVIVPNESGKSVISKSILLYMRNSTDNSPVTISIGTSSGGNTDIVGSSTISNIAEDQVYYLLPPPSDYTITLPITEFKVTTGEIRFNVSSAYSGSGDLTCTLVYEGIMV